MIQWVRSRHVVKIYDMVCWGWRYALWCDWGIKLVIIHCAWIGYEMAYGVWCVYMKWQKGELCYHEMYICYDIVTYDLVWKGNVCEEYACNGNVCKRWNTCVEWHVFVKNEGCMEMTSNACEFTMYRWYVVIMNCMWFYTQCLAYKVMLHTKRYFQSMCF